MVGMVNAATTPIIPTVISTSTKVKPALRHLFLKIDSGISSE